MMVKVKRLGKYAAMTRPRPLNEELDSVPVLHHHIGWQIGLENFIPSNHPPMVLRQNLLHSRVEICLQVVRTLHLVFAHEASNLWIALPVFSVALVPSDVNVLIRKQRTHLSEKCVEKLVRAFERGVERRIENARPMLD